MDDLDTLLARHPPFDALSEQQRCELAAEAVVREFEAGESALVEDGPPAEGLWVMLRGAMALFHEGQIIQIIEPGECFGHASLLTGMAPTFGVRARERSACALIGPAAARRVLATEAGVTYVARTMRTRLTRTGHTVHALRDVGTTPVAAIMRPPAWAPPEATAAEAARRLGEPGVTALLVDTPGGVAVVGDSDIRRGLATDGFDGSRPARALAPGPARTVPASQLAIEATIDMLAEGVEHLVVLERGRVCGVVSATDLLGLEARSPIGLRHSILMAVDETGLERAVAGLPAQFVDLARAGVPPRDLGRVLSLAQDTVVDRLIEFSLARLGPAPVPWAWLDLGSAARREFTLASDQDNALAYDRPVAGEEETVDGWFAQLGQEVNDGLARCGIGADNNGVLAGRPLWRMSKAAWLRTFDQCLTEPSESHLVRATVAFDFRATAGGLAVAAELAARVRRAREHPPFMRLMARGAAGFQVALGFRGQLAVEDDGRLDLKRGGIVPLVNVVRYHALAAGVTISATLDRIEAAAAAGTDAGGSLSQEDADALREAFEVITRLRFEHHAARIEAGLPADNRIDPNELAPIARSDLRAALQAVRRAQRRLPV